MKTICKYLGYCIIVLGLICSIFIAKNLGVSVVSERLSVDIVRNWPLTILYFITSLFVTAAFASVLLGISEILNYLQTTIPNISNAVSSETQSDSEDDDFWKCPHCGKRNPPYTGTCSCGHSKP